MLPPGAEGASAPPPNVADHEAATGTAVKPSMVAVGAPGEECAQNCASYWKTCRQTCKEAGCDGCDRAYKLCVPSCFRK